MKHKRKVIQRAKHSGLATYVTRCAQRQLVWEASVVFERESTEMTRLATEALFINRNRHCCSMLSATFDEVKKVFYYLFMKVKKWFFDCSTYSANLFDWLHNRHCRVRDFPCVAVFVHAVSKLACVFHGRAG